MANRGIEWGLLGPREADRLLDRHVLNSMAVEQLIPSNATVADIGSGAGLPGIPLALARMDLQVTLIEPLLRRFTFLTSVVDELGLADQVGVVRSRAEDHRTRYDVVCSRALAPLEKLIPWCDPLRSPGGAILALKGSTATDELGRVAPLLAQRRLIGEVHTVRATSETDTTYVIRLIDR